MKVYFTEFQFDDLQCDYTIKTGLFFSILKAPHMERSRFATLLCSWNISHSTCNTEVIGQNIVSFHFCHH